ncbi:threonine ammonia-lyase [Minwuia thermotolerans]|uniref:Pyridoxal-5'-phosphate-dependent protein n=1 Tax=Minwuia thermotolerans TaxID=2056226 RepID=A0A2M9G4G1_9PROT|nr:threonine/serine dehydratase [Minwuia thermotolerans]PJK30609.1 pyridoxal-5'-phosphate-dependent protein [Minwuia thermotolerans]
MTVSVDDIRAAAARLRGRAIRPPLLESARLNDRLGGRLLVKPECLQRTGSFKFRGAYNTLSAMDPAVRARGVIAYSSGNHAQGVALSAKLFGAPATIIMPHDAPELKKRNTAEYGAEVVLYDRYSENREALGERLMADRGLTLVKPYDQESVIAGQGTVGLEIAEQCAEAGVTPDFALCPAGGGGLIGGVSLALKDAFPQIAVHPAEPADFDDWGRSLAGGVRVAVDPSARSICDAILTPTPGEITFEIGRRTLSAGVGVSDEEALAAMRDAFLELKIVAEPGGVVALAALLSGRVELSGRTAVVVVSGGNVDPALFRRALDMTEMPSAA